MPLLQLPATTRNQCQPQPTVETPKALEDKSAYSAIKTRSSYDGNLVENLYDELIEKTPELKALESDIQTLKITSRNQDSVATFNKYNNHSTAYYNSANSLLLGVSDSLVKNRMKTIIDASLTKYTALTAKHTELIKKIDIKTATLSDVHVMLKIVKTLPMIEKYQHDNLPSIMPIEQYLNRLDGTLNTIDAQIKK